MDNGRRTTTGSRRESGRSLRLTRDSARPARLVFGYKVYVDNSAELIIYETLSIFKLLASDDNLQQILRERHECRDVSGIGHRIA